MIMAPLGGCFREEVLVQEQDGVFDNLCQENGGTISNTTWYHYENATDATKVSDLFDGTSILVGDNVPVCAVGTYYGIGMTTFEPTIGVTSLDNLYITSWGNGPAGSTAIVRCSGMVSMSNISEYVCEDVYSALLPVPNSNDPYVYVDPWTDRIMKFDMHALLGMTVEWSDNEGQSWVGPSVATGSVSYTHLTLPTKA